MVGFHKFHTYLYLVLLNTLMCSFCLQAQNQTWMQPSRAGHECFDVDIDSNNYIYSISQLWDSYSAFFDSTAVPRTLFAGHSLFITKTDTNNNLQWLKPIESSFNFMHPKIRVSPSQTILAAGKVWDRLKIDSVDLSFPLHSEPPLFLAQFKSNGSLNWVNLIKSNTIYIFMRDIAYDSQNNIYITASTDDTVTFGDFDSLGQWVPAYSLSLIDNGRSSFVAKYSPTGKFISAKMLPVINTKGQAIMEYYSMKVDDQKNIYLTGWLYGTIQNGSASIESDGIEILLLKLDSTMNLMWSKHFGPGNGDLVIRGNCLAFSKSKDYFYLTGNFYGTTDFGNGPINSNDKNIFLAKYSTAGNLKWIRTFGCWSGSASYTEEGQKIYVDNEDFVYVGGFFFNTLQIADTSIQVFIDPHTSNDFSDFFVAKYFANGDFSWITSAGSNYSDDLGSLLKDKYNHVFIAGSTHQDSHFGNHTIFIEPDNIGIRGFLARYNDRPEKNRFDTSSIGNKIIEGDNKIKIYPIPFSEHLKIDIQNPVHSEISIKIFNSSGNEVINDNIHSGYDVQNLVYKIDNDLPGLYLLMILIGNESYSFKLIKQ
ncbi:MAG: T9SS type A sorting domain-containing protein [Bacteroidetes bacterium]|nr:T9SS type A sorting domain-containing protein [Bacteroidota bacterium]